MASLFASASQSSLHGLAASSQNKALRNPALESLLQKVLIQQTNCLYGDDAVMDLQTVLIQSSSVGCLDECKVACGRALGSLTSLLAKERAEGRGETVSSSEVDFSENPSWDDISMLQQELRPTWEKVVNKLHARINFGSNSAQSKLRVFNQKIWDQVSSLRNDQKRMIEKSRMPSNDSQRIGRHLHDPVPADQKPRRSDSEEDSDEKNASNSDDDGDSDSEEDDNEEDGVIIKIKQEACLQGLRLKVYDDRPFTRCFKTFILVLAEVLVSNIRAGDLNALKSIENKVGCRSKSKQR